MSPYANGAAANTRIYAKKAHAAFEAARERLADLAANRPLDLDIQHHDNFIATRALYAIYHAALLLDGNGTATTPTPRSPSASWQPESARTAGSSRRRLSRPV
ncbi:hypothetical protein ACIO6T_40920 [Streptomyces sp. NPDC087532]|uniref:hypothetical protein n=1 Tax=Streptomyces sp. NPDC087532 TaxID=3365795 RepID=UPI0038303A2F